MGALKNARINVLLPKRKGGQHQSERNIEVSHYLYNITDTVVMLRTTHISVKQARVQSPLQHPDTVVLLMGGRPKQPAICLLTNWFSFQFSTEEGKGECFRYSLYNLLLYTYTKRLAFFCIPTFYSTSALTSSFGQAGILSAVSYCQHSEDLLLLS